MDGSTDSSVQTGIGGPESNAGNDQSITPEHGGNAGAIDPDAARNAGATGTDGDDFAAAISDTPAASGTRQKRKYTRRKSAEQSQAGSDAPLNINGVEKILYSIHSVTAALLKVPELEIDAKEAKELASAIEGVTDQYKLTLDPKTAAWIDLGRAVGVIYGPRCVSFYMRKKIEAESRRPSATIHPIRPQAPQPAPPQPQPPQQQGPMPAFDPGKIIDG